MSAIAASAARPSPPAVTRPKWAVFAVVSCSVFMTTLSTGMINVALPVLTVEFAEPLVTAQWVVLGYLLCITALVLPTGRLADLVGRKRVFLSSFVGFGLTSVLCGLAPTMATLIVARILQGVAGAAMQANMGALTTAAFPSDQRGRALGLTASVVAIGLLSGPLIGGVITQYLGWRWTFYLFVPLCVVSTLVGLRLLPDDQGRLGSKRWPIDLHHFDLLGNGLLLAMIVSFLLFLNRGPQEGWGSASALGFAAASLVAAAAFFRVERRSADPAVDLHLFDNRGFRAAVVSGFLTFSALGSVVLLMPFYLQFVLGLSVAQAGLVLISLPTMQMVIGPISGSLSDRLGARLVASTGLFVMLAGMLSLTTLGEQAGLIEVVLRLCVVGAGMAMFNSPNSSSLFNAVRVDQLGQASAWWPLTRNLGQSVGQATAGALWTAVVVLVAGASAMGAPPAAMVVGFRGAFLVAAALLTGALLTSIFGRPPRPSAP
ncbi:MAG: MFS transporter [Chloroflexi bacterium]|nr:MFS transporter [Chloroflexota bacterium]